ncbi:MAG: potassium-transporting ATPase subunit KdpA, partial [Anaerolineae bacterium]|nr:potassium-transporting ATPase subunit KdpA [Anaerolineae bacterium]
MTGQDVIQLVLYFGLLIIATPILGAYMARIFMGKSTPFTPILAPIERGIYRLAGINPTEEQEWHKYALSLLIFNLIGFVMVFALQMLQGSLPLNPANVTSTSPDLAFNTATSFMTNTNWQAYGGETTMSYLTQMLGLAVQNFLSASTGIAVMVALARGLANKSSKILGNFWSDMVKTTLYVLLPLSIIVAVMLIGQGVVQNLNPYVEAQTLSGETQYLPQGPAASQIAIKQLGTNGGGFFNVNSAHPYENPTPVSNFLQMFAILLIPASLTYTYGMMVGDKRQGWTIFFAMFTLLIIGLTVMLISEYSTNPIYGVGGLMEGKETRFGVTNSVLWGVTTTAASNGSVNSMHSSFSPIAGGIAMLNIMLGEIVFGGVGAGMYGMFIFIILTVFIAGLMVGRTPEYLGKKIESREIKLVTIAVLLPNATILLFTALALLIPEALANRTNTGAHGLSEILYAFT